LVIAGGPDDPYEDARVGYERKYGATADR